MAAADRHLGTVLRALRDGMPPDVYEQSIGSRERSERKATPAIVWLPRRGTLQSPIATGTPPCIIDRVVQIDVEIYAATSLDEDDESQDFDIADEAIADVVRTISEKIPRGALGWIGEAWDESHGAVQDGRLVTLSFTVRVPVTKLAATRAPVTTKTITPTMTIQGEP